ncbi:ComEC/Rec2-like protein [Prevotella sp. DNF00663]|uniref:ComEC/Rec2 family competence protein n=1 Tax=Prevotella sp. DNF00663 TaxID=1384078 RepID=UPI000784E97B|nr:ComEC/Rec2 family competence protein [Prevotella sp. DNF00663]KXB84804.1 ComEC/Rec2-like protein [Prevotella sp. DNF00663]
MNHLSNLQSIPLVRIAAVFIFGILIGNHWGDTFSLRIWTSVGLLFVLLAWWIRYRVWQTVMIVLATMVVGIWLITFHNHRLHPTLPDEKCHIEAVVIGNPTVHGRVVMCDMDVQTIQRHSLKRSLKVRASLYGDNVRSMRLAVGNRVEFVSRLERPQNFLSTGHFDYERWMRVHGYVATAFVQMSQLHVLSGHEAGSFRNLLLQWRRLLADRYMASGMQQDVLAVVVAMTLGDKSMLSRQTKHEYSVAGTSHILALSGLHLSIIFMVLTLLFGRSLIGRLAALVAIWAYAMLVGLPPSVTRAATMMTVYSLVTLLHRNNISLNTLALAAIIMLAANPLCLWDVGFQLSFCSVAAILCLYRPLFDWLNPANSVLRWVGAMMCTSVAAQVGTAPLVAYYFGRFSCYFLLSNLIVIPCATLLLYMACLLLLIGWLPLCAQVLEWAVGLIAGVMNAVVSVIARWPGASIEHIHIGGLRVFLLYVIIVGVCLLASFHPLRPIGNNGV